MNRIRGLEGARGVAAFVVFTHHFFLIFKPDFYFGQHTWVNALFNPDLALTWFFVHSGFVLSWKTRQLEGDDYKLALIDQSLRRYFRLIPPVLLSVFLMYLLMKAGLTFNHEYGSVVNSRWLSQYLHFKPQLSEVFYQSFFGVYFDFKSSTTYNPNLWTIGHELIGSYILFAMLALFGWSKNAVWIFFPLGLFISPWKGLMCFMMGAALSRMPVHRTPLIFLVIFAFFGFAISDFKGPEANYLRSLGATMLMYVLIQAPRLRNILAIKPFQWLGNISYSLYVLHFVLLVSFTSYFGQKWQSHRSLDQVLILYGLSTIVLLMASTLAWYFVDYQGIRLAKKFSGLFSKKPSPA